MKLKALIQELNPLKINGSLDVDIQHISHDSRDLRDNSIFVAITGFQVDGHQFIDQAIARGAKALIVEKTIPGIKDITTIQVKDCRKALAQISSIFYGEPTKKLELIGVTGTNGKTSVTYFIKSILEQARKKTGLIGTIGNVIGEEMLATKNTTPDSLELQKIFYQMVEENFDNCVMEVSSHSLELDRVACCDFDIGIFTNLSPDHLEFHKNMENYLKAKSKLFYMTRDFNIINCDDSYGRKLIERLKNINTPLITYGIEKKADVYATDIKYSAQSICYTVHTPVGSFPIKVNIPGLIYVYNSLAAIACAIALDISSDIIQKGIEKVQGIRGRFEVVPTNKDFTVIIDYAHTGDGLEKALTTIDQFALGRKIVVFGAGGCKGRDKRWGMGKAAAKYCDLAIITSDNPKTENPRSIMDEIIKAVEYERGNYIAIVDRKEAIRYAIHNSKPGDVILLAGKGHETTQIIGTEVIPFDEREIVIEALKEIG